MRHPSHGPPSIPDSAAEYFDASDDILCGSSSEVSDESGLSDGSTTNSEPEEGHGGDLYGSVVTNSLYVHTFSQHTILTLVFFHVHFSALSIDSTIIIIYLLTTASVTRKYRASISRTPNSVVPKSTGRRSTLPAHCPDNSHVGLMAILYNNIGKDLKLTLFCIYIECQVF